jgi:hypothetical protein
MGSDKFIVPMGLSFFAVERISCGAVFLFFSLIWFVVLLLSFYPRTRSIKETVDQ